MATSRHGSRRSFIIVPRLRQHAAKASKAEYIQE